MYFCCLTARYLAQRRMAYRAKAAWTSLKSEWTLTPGFHFHRQLFQLQAEPRANAESTPPLPAEGWVPQRWPPGP